MPYPPDMLEPDDATPTESIEFRRELARLLNRYNIDNWAEIPGTILADMLADLVVPIRWGRIATAKWMGQPLLGDKPSATLRVKLPQPIWPGEDTAPAPGNPYPQDDPRGFNEYQPCATDLCAAARQHTGRCIAARQKREGGE